MAAALAVHGDVTDETGTVHKAVAIVVRQNVATLKAANGTVIETRTGVVTVTQVNRNDRDVTFGDGTVWHVIRRARPCGCH